MFPRFRAVKQADRSDCGPACLVAIAWWFGLHLSLPWARQATGTNRDGTTVSGLIHGAERLGFLAKGVRGPATALPAVPVPAIAHCRLASGGLHFVVLRRWTPRVARVMDPASGRNEFWPAARFLERWTGILVLLAPGESFRPGDRTTRPWTRLWRLLRPHRAVLLQALAASVVTTILGLGTSIFVQKIVDEVIPDGNGSLLNLLALVMVAALAVRLALGYLQSLTSLRTAQRIDVALVLGYHEHLLRLPQEFFDTMRVGEITSRVADAIKIRNFLNSSLLSLVLHPLVLLFSLGALLAYSPALGLLSLALLPAHGGVLWAVDRLNRTGQRRIMERTADFDAQLVESLGAQTLIRHHRLERVAAHRLERRLVRVLRATWRAALGGLAGATAANLATSAYGIALLWLGARLVLQSELSTGQLMSCYTLSGYLCGPLNALVSLNGTVREATAATDRLFEIMDLEIVRDDGILEPVFPLRQGFLLDRVTFRHTGRPPSLQGVTAALPAGRITVLAGPSGSGKSTLLALLQRSYAPESGRILLDGHELRAYRLDALRRSIAVMSQQVQLLSGTILENLVPGADQPDLPRLLDACRRAGAAEFITALPRGFLTTLGENGADLSGGQRQRLALARALYLEAPILLLDEPTSALDAAAESSLADLLVSLRAEGRTIIVATHSPRLLALADGVVALSTGGDLPLAAADPLAAGAPPAISAPQSRAGSSA